MQLNGITQIEFESILHPLDLYLYSHLRSADEPRRVNYIHSQVIEQKIHDTKVKSLAIESPVLRVGLSAFMRTRVQR